jgi:hypothetical protein
MNAGPLPPMLGSLLAFALINGSGIAIAILCWRMSRRSKATSLILCVALCALLILKSWLTHKPAWEAAIFPWPWYIYLQGYWIFAIGAAFFALAAPLLPAPRNRRAVLYLGGAVLIAGGMSTSWMLYLPDVGEELQADAQHQCCQSTAFTCAPTACVCALSYLGIHTTEREMARLCLTRAGGTTRFNTFRGLVLKLEGSDFRAHMVEIPPADLCVPGTISVIDFPEIYHAIAVYGVGNGVTLHDPTSRKPEQLTLQRLGERYGGLAIILERKSPVPPP